MVAGMCATSGKKRAEATVANGAPKKKAKSTKPKPEQPEEHGEEHEEDGIVHPPEGSDEQEQDPTPTATPNAKATPKAKPNPKAKAKAKANPQAKTEPKAKAKPSLLKQEWAKFLAEYMQEQKGKKPVPELMKEAAEKRLTYLFRNQFRGNPKPYHLKP